MCLALNSFLYGAGGASGGARADRIGDGAADLVEVAQDVAHAVLDLRVAEPVSGHGYKLLRPQVHKIRNLAGSHDYATCQGQAVILQKFMLLEAAFKEDISVMADDVRLALAVQRHHSGRGHVLDLVRAEQDSLAEEVAEDVVSTDKLHAPFKSV